MTRAASVVPITELASLGTLPPHEIALRLDEAEQRYVDAAQQAAPLSYQIQLAREIVALRMVRMVGQGAVIETAMLTESVVQEMAQTGLFTQVIIDGLQGKVSAAVIDKIGEVQGAFAEGASLIHAVTTGAILERIQAFKTPSSDVRFRDTVCSVALDKVPRRLPDRRR